MSSSPHNQDPVVVLISNIAACPKLRGVPWVEYSLVVGLDRSGRVAEIYGFAFDEDRVLTAFSTGLEEIEEPLGARLAELYPDGEFPIRVLVQFNRISGRYHIDFEDDDVARWQVTPDSIFEVREALRPNLG